MRVALNDGSLGSGYFEAEVQAIAEHYCTLSGTEKDSFVEQRRAYMKTMEEVLVRCLPYLK